MAFQASRLAAAFADLVNNDPALMLLAPGGCWHRRGPAEGTDLGRNKTMRRPYMVVGVVAGEKQFATDQSYLQDFTVTLAVYGADDAGTTGQVADYLDQFSFSRAALVGLPCKVKEIYPAPEMLDLDPEEKLGQDVVIASKAWNVLLHCTDRT